MNCLLLKKDRSALKKLLIWKAAGGGGPAPQTETVIGTEVSFITSKARPLVDCYVDFFPVQAGSGDPSPENVRQISGRNGISVFVSAESSSGTEYPVTWTEAGTVYAGTVDIVRGLLRVTHGMGVMDGSTALDVRSSGKFVLITPPNMLAGNHYTDPNVFCDKAVKVDSMGSVANTVLAVHFGDDSTICFYYFNTALNLTSKSAISAWLAENPITYTYPLATPITYQVSRKSIRTLIGTNYIRNNADGEMTVTYIY